MMFLKVVAAILALCVVAVVGLIVSYPWLYPTYVVRYRLTVNTLVGEQPHSGSTVIEVRVKRQPQLVADMPPLHFSVTGEAAFVDLGGGRNLVATLAPGATRDSDAIGILFRAFNIPFAADSASPLKNFRGEHRLEPSNWPAFVTFRNVAILCRLAKLAGHRTIRTSEHSFSDVA